MHRPCEERQTDGHVPGYLYSLSCSFYIQSISNLLTTSTESMTDSTLFCKADSGEKTARTVLDTDPFVVHQGASMIAETEKCLKRGDFNKIVEEIYAECGIERVETEGTISSGQYSDHMGDLLPF